MLIESVLGNLADPRWREAAPAAVDALRLDQWQAQKNRLRATTDAGMPVALSLPRGSADRRIGGGLPPRTAAAKFLSRKCTA